MKRDLLICFEEQFVNEYFQENNFNSRQQHFSRIDDLDLLLMSTRFFENAKMKLLIIESEIIHLLNKDLFFMSNNMFIKSEKYER